MLILPENCRGLFKKPFGHLYSDFSAIVPLLKDRMFCTVGDVVTANAYLAGLTPAVAVIDGVTKRDTEVSDASMGVSRLYAENAAGTISDSLLAVLKEAVSHPPVVVEVEGEEDLAVLPLIPLLEDGTVILYGQPDEGVVFCEVGPSLRTLSGQILGKFTFQ